MISELATPDVMTARKKSENPLNPDYVPSLFAYLSAEQRKRKINSYSKFEQMQAVKRKRRTHDVGPVAPCDNCSHMQIDDCGDTSAQEGRGQTADHSYCNSAVYAESSVPCSNEACQETVRRLTEECTALRSEVYQLREKSPRSSVLHPMTRKPIELSHLEGHLNSLIAPRGSEDRGVRRLPEES
ncbi:hypothetical protein DPX16_0832 [Anabarilius grahami]|uniref:Uncharacterized protein n=1 Tax=Anabarilius grahami TaxID=495550 RepID=A0A3N0XMI2_ANAGA|nr:hypothetical protein DPX16_0832 [Anabarilius grahami]